MGILDDYTWVVWLTRDGRWHSAGTGGLCFYSDDSARQYASGLVGDSEGTTSFIGTAVAAYCVHAPYRYRAIKIAKEAHKSLRVFTGLMQDFDLVASVGV